MKSKKENREIILDLFKLQKTNENHNKSWILANGKNLKKEIEHLLKDLIKTYGKSKLVNKISSKLNLNIRVELDFNPSNLGEEIKRNRECLKLNRYFLQRNTKTSGKEWNKIEGENWIPSCRKLRRIYK